MATLREHFDTHDVAINSVYDNEWVAQSYTTASAYTITSVRGWHYRMGAGSYTYTVSLKAADGSHFPTGAALSSGTLDINGWSTSGDGEEHTFTMSSYNVANATEYCLENKCVDAPNANRAVIKGSTSGVAGIASYSVNGGSSWNDLSSYDFYYQIYGDDVTTAYTVQVTESGAGSGAGIVINDSPTQFKAGFHLNLRER